MSDPRPPSVAEQDECTCNFCLTNERDGYGHDDGPALTVALDALTGEPVFPRPNEIARFGSVNVDALVLVLRRSSDEAVPRSTEHRVDRNIDV